MKKEEIKELMEGLVKWKQEINYSDPIAKDKNEAFNEIFKDLESQARSVGGSGFPSDLNISIPPPSGIRDM